MTIESFPSTNIPTNFSLVPQQPLAAPFTVQLQDKRCKNWCWAAVTASVSLYWDPTGGATQCSIASLVLGGEAGTAGCCNNGNVNPLCDVEWALDGALSKAGHLQSYLEDMNDPAVVIRHVAAKEPVCIRIEWPGGAGHYIGISRAGVGSDGKTYLTTSDPIYGPGDYLADDVVYGAYAPPHDGRWTDTYLTQA